MIIEYRPRNVHQATGLPDLDWADARESNNGTGVDTRAEKGRCIMDEKRKVNFSVKGDGWAGSVTFANAVIDYAGMTDETRMQKADKSVIIEHQKVLRALPENEVKKLASKPGYTFAASMAGHKIESPEEIRRKAIAQAKTMTPEERQAYIKELQAMDTK